MRLDHECGARLRRCLGACSVAVAVVLLAGESGGAEPDAASATTLKLRQVRLPSADYVVSRPVNGVPELVLGSYVIPPDKADFVGDAKSVSMSLRGETVTMLREPAGPSQWAFGVRAGKQLVLLREIEGSTALRSATLTLSDKQPYTLAFPHHYSGMLQGQLHSQVWYRSGAVAAGKIDGADVAFYDSNCDGVYRPQDDAMRVGVDCRVPVFAPMTANFATPRGIYHVAGLAENASELRYAAYAGKTGKLAVAGSSPGAEIQLVLQSKDAELAMVCIANQPGMVAIPGKYDVLYGTVADAEGALVAVVRPDTIRPVEVAEGKLQTVRVGGPVSLEFNASLKNERLQIDPASFCIRGKNGEQYLKVQWAELPEIGVQRGKTVKRVGKMAFG